MTNNHFFLGTMCAITLCFVLSSCEQTDEKRIRPVREADYVIYSGRHIHSGSRNEAQAKIRQQRNADFAYYKVQDGNVPAEYRDRIPAAVTADERAFVLDYIRQHPYEHTQDFHTSLYFLQCIGSSYAYYSGNTLVDHNGAWHGMTGGNHMDYLVINNQHINDYNASWGPDALCVNLPFADPTYHDSWGDKDNTKHNAWAVYAIPGYGYYLGFDYRTAKNSGEYYDGDGVYNDWVIKITPLDTENQTPDEPVVISVETAGLGEVEANLSLNMDRGEDDYIFSKLSIHVRDTTDVEVYLPVPSEFYCELTEADVRTADFVQYATMQIDNQTVALHVRFEQEGIRINTRGLNAQVLEYCRNTYLDGITFEVWTYYRDTTRAELQSLLNRTNITFTANPGRYVNGFGEVDGQVNPLDCTVNPPAAFTYTEDEGFNKIYTIQ